jgi:hypothetical protein
MMMAPSLPLTADGRLLMGKRRGIDVFSGNMPFLGGRRISTEHGGIYAEWLTARYGGTGGTDYVGYFFHRASELISESGCIGFIATAAISDGDNRRTVLEPLTRDGGFELHAATTGFPWPGNVQVNVSTVHLAKGRCRDALRERVLNGREVERINSRLRSGDDWPAPIPLPENAGLALVGCFLRGEGFILEQAEARALLDAHPEHVDVVRPFLVGDDLNNSLDQSAQRYVIDFRDMTLDEARRYPHALAIVEERVRPNRERLKTTGADAEHRNRWWRFANVRLELRIRAQTMPRFLATARVSKRPVFTFAPSTWTPSEQVVVFPLPTGTAFAVLQSRIHRAWVKLQATHMGEGLRYSATDCFAPFPFPARDPADKIPALEVLGEEVHEKRREFAARRGIGLTETYNLLHDASAMESDVTELRTLHEQLDRAVLDAYSWSDVAVPDYCAPLDVSDEPNAFEDAVAARLSALNAARSTHTDQTATKPGLGVRKTKMQRPGPKKARSSNDPDGRRWRRVR